MAKSYEEKLSEKLELYNRLSKEISKADQILIDLGAAFDDEKKMWIAPSPALQNIINAYVVADEKNMRQVRTDIEYVRDSIAGMPKSFVETLKPDAFLKFAEGLLILFNGEKFYTEAEFNELTA